LSEAEIVSILKEQYEEDLEEFLDLMTKQDADAFRNLENRHGEDGYKLFGIVLTNGYPMHFNEDNELGYHAIGNMGSRINHTLFCL